MGALEELGERGFLQAGREAGQGAGERFAGAGVGGGAQGLDCLALEPDGVVPAEQVADGREDVLADGADGDEAAGQLGAQVVGPGILLEFAQQ